MNTFTAAEIAIRHRMRLRQMEHGKPFVYFVSGLGLWMVSFPVIAGKTRGATEHATYADAMRYVRSVQTDTYEVRVNGASETTDAAGVQDRIYQFTHGRTLRTYRNFIAAEGETLEVFYQPSGANVTAEHFDRFWRSLGRRAA